MKHHSKITPPKPGQDARLDQSVLSRIAALKTMSVKELKTEWERLLGSAAPNNIVTDKLWDQVDAILQGNRHARSSNSRMQTPAPLKGLIFTDTGAAMTPTATKKRGKLYRYYVSMDVIKNRTTEDDSGGDQAPVRLPAGMVEDAIVTEVRRILQTPEVVTQVLAALKRDLKPLSQTYADQDAFLHDVPRLIIEHNIYGVDIDPRAAQIASLALWLRAQRAWHEAGVKAKDRPQVGRGHVVAAVAPPAEVDLRKRFMEELDPLDAELFEQTLFMLKGLARTAQPALLRGLIFTETGAAMTPHHTKRKGKRYCYYTSMDVIRKRPAAELRGPQRLPGAMVEDSVIGEIRRMLRTPEVAARTARAVRKNRPDLDETTVVAALAQFDDLWKALIPAEQARIVQLLVARITVSEAGLAIDLRHDGLGAIATLMAPPKKEVA